MTMMTMTGVGRFVKTPELREITKSNGDKTCVCEFTLAVDEKRGDRSLCSYLDFCIYDSAAEVLVKYMGKGDPILIRSTPRQNSWTDQETGKKKSRIIFRVDEFKFVGRSRKNQDNDNESDNF